MIEANQTIPNLPVNFTNLGVSYCLLKKYPEARIAFQKAYDLEPANTQNLVNLATVCLWQGHADEALDLYQKGISQNPREPVFFLRTADIYLSMKIKPQALEMLRLASVLNPYDPKVLREMGEDYEKAGRKDLAQQCFEKAKVGTAASKP